MQGDLLSISRFADLSGIKRKNLIFYDEIGILKPSHVAENGYRYYSYQQLDTANLIFALKDIGVPLKEIKAYIDIRTPEALGDVFAKQRKKVMAQIESLHRILEFMDAQTQLMNEAEQAVSGEIRVRYLEKEELYMGPKINYADGKRVSEAFGEFYHYAEESGISPFITGALNTKEAFLRGEWQRPEQVYCLLNGGNGEKPAGWYACGYSYGAYGQYHGLYEMLRSYIQDNGLEVLGNAYEEYILNEIAVKDPTQYLLRVQVHIAAPKDSLDSGCPV